jgi:hypothetical protein
LSNCIFCPGNEKSKLQGNVRNLISTQVTSVSEIKL